MSLKEAVFAPPLGAFHPLGLEESWILFKSHDWLPPGDIAAGSMWQHKTNACT